MYAYFVTVYLSITTFIIEPIASRSCISTTWNHITNHIGQRPDCPESPDRYLYQTVDECKTKCESSPTCNVIVRYNWYTTSDDAWHCYFHSCPDINNIQYITEDRWGYGASRASQYILTQCTMPSSATTTKNPSDYPSIMPSQSVALTSNPSTTPSESPSFYPTQNPTTPCTWHHDINHIGKRPDCPSSPDIWYMWETIPDCQLKCELDPTCNVIVRYKSWAPEGVDAWHCYAHSCPDINNIAWITEDRWGYGAEECTQYIFTKCPTKSPTTSYPSIQPSASPSFEPSIYPTFLPSTSIPSESPSFEPTIEPTSNPSDYPSIGVTIPRESPSFYPGKKPTSDTFRQEEFYGATATQTANKDAFVAQPTETVKFTANPLILGLVAAVILIICCLFVFVYVWQIRKYKPRDAQTEDSKLAAAIERNLEFANEMNNEQPAEPPVDDEFVIKTEQNTAAGEKHLSLTVKIDTSEILRPADNEKHAKQNTHVSRISRLSSILSSDGVITPTPTQIQLQAIEAQVTAEQGMSGFVSTADMYGDDEKEDSDDEIVYDENARGTQDGVSLE